MEVNNMNNKILNYSVENNKINIKYSSFTAEVIFINEDIVRFFINYTNEDYSFAIKEFPNKIVKFSSDFIDDRNFVRFCNNLQRANFISYTCIDHYNCYGFASTLFRGEQITSNGCSNIACDYNLHADVHLANKWVFVFNMIW